MPTIQALGTAFTAMKVTVNTKTKQQLEEESIGQTSDTSKTSNTQKANDKTISPNDNEQTVIFADPTNGNLVKLNLSNKNIEKLKSHFSNEDFYERKDKTLRLNGEAEAYVSGWFGDIAYKREFLKADADNDGKLSEGEYQNTRNEFAGLGVVNGIGEKVLSIKEEITAQYMFVGDGNKARQIKYGQNDSVHNSLNDEVNKTIVADDNLDSKVTLQEAYTMNQQSLTGVIVQHATKALGNFSPDNDPTLGKDYFSGGAQTDADLELLALQMRATQKLQA